VLLAARKADIRQAKPFVSQSNIHEELQSYEEFCECLDVGDVASLNRKVSEGRITELITVAEARHEQMLARLASQLYERRGEKRVVIIAGPSASGKTTMSKRLRSHLAALGMRPIAIGLDDYFVDREKTPMRADGQYDFESIGALDVELFYEHLIALMEGKPIEAPRFDFLSGRRLSYGVPMKADEGSPIIIEGILGLKEELTPHIPKSSKYKIYINDFTHLNIDPSNRIPTSDTRLVRRIVRDSVQRGHSALSTIAMWQSVRLGEEVNIYPYSGDADFVFNSSLFYEMGVLCKYAIPALSSITGESPFYHEAKRLTDFLSFFLPIADESAIYSSSLLREFIGGSVFERL
jgi:uridine kinase